MRGAESYSILRPNGSSFTAKWDKVIPETLFTEMNIASLDGVTPIDENLIKDGIVENYTPGVYEQVNTNDLVTIVRAIDSNALVSVPGFSKAGGGPFTATLTPTLKTNRFSITQANIDITLV